MKIEKANPHTKYPVPPYPKQKENSLAKEDKLNPPANHGEDSYTGNNRLKDKRAIITGGDSGIGKAIAIAFAREGADVLISYLGDEEIEDAKKTAKYVEDAGRKAVLVKGDIRSEAHCKKIISIALKALGGIDILINNAAFQRSRGLTADITAAEWKQTFDTNMHAMFYLCKAAEKHMEPGGSIINTTSVNAYSPSPDILPYAASKSAIQNFTANLNQILLMKGKGIRVNAVAPGSIWTPLISATVPNPEEFGKSTPIGRPGQPVEVAHVFVFLAAKEAAYIAGATIPVTGGMITI
ncbi:SDR family oxidoreductase [Pedobacter insulae]|uniref:NAD(P)-dependent dehydrogenase, short-chain alcohol dehydrogenase family n=1 Tax=Pedobacter insulae TaxID=414048 RepID=A0A1I2WNA9_9SPHI|nr:SDR family oxidoreductase [Pedobacter insulae]SFH02159.1 hypothetical protein SAMN04489864_104141 [Pedobacter insulae]